MKTLDRLNKYYLLKENWVEAENRWVKTGNIDKEKFDILKSKFTTFSKKNLIPSGRERDIAFWMKKPVSEFKDFMSGIEEFSKKKEQEKGKKSDVVVVFENSKVKVIMPKTEEASCEYGQNTKWCTAGKIDNTFKEYLYTEGVSLYYVIVKGAPMDESLMYNEEYVRLFKSAEDEKRYMNISPKDYNKIAIAVVRKDKLRDIGGKKQAQMQIFDTLDNLMYKQWLQDFCNLYKVPYDIFRERTIPSEKGYKILE